EYLRDGTPGRMSNQMHLVETYVIDEPQRVRGPLLYFVGRLAFARAHPAMIEGHNLECRRKGSDLCRPVGAAFAKARHEHDGCTSAGNVIGQHSAIGRNHQHCHVASRLGWADKKTWPSAAFNEAPLFIAIRATDALQDLLYFVCGPWPWISPMRR